MKCGHVSNAFIGNTNKPCCAICAPDPEAFVIDHEVFENKGLKGRKAKCRWCNKTTESNWRLPFFKYRPDKDYDDYYCGCGGWD